MIDWIDERRGLEALVAAMPTIPRWAIYYLLLVAIYFSLFYHSTTQEFFYFQF